MYTKFPPSLKIQLFIFSVLATFIYHIPTLFVQVGLTPGDAGGNCYTVQAVAQYGDAPYRDFWWNYGPLPLYINAIFFKLFGADIHQLIWVRIILKSLFAGVFFLGAARIMPLFSAALTAVVLQVLMPEFKHNFQHYMGVCAEIGICWAVLAYLCVPKSKYLAWAFIFILLLGFVKLNFGFLFLIAVFLCFILCDIFVHRQLSFRGVLVLLCWVMATVIFWGVIHYFLLKDISWQQINQCFPVAKGYRYYDSNGFSSKGFIKLFDVVLKAIKANKIDMFIALIGVLSFLWVCIVSCYRRTLKPVGGRPFFLIIGILVILGVAAFHEFIKGEADYQLYWGKPFSLILIAYCVSEACQLLWRFVRIVVFVLIFGMVSSGAYAHWQYLEKYQKPGHYFEFKRMNIYVTEHPKDIKSMVDTARYIDQNLSIDEDFYTFPHTAIYYFLTDHRMPHWLFSFWRLIKISPEQELDLVKALEHKKVNYVVQGSVCYAGFGAWGRFGVDHGVIFDKYLKKYFQEVARFGEWKQEGDKFIYIGGMGTRILKRKSNVYIDINTIKDLD